MKTGRVYLISAGPGDPSLISVKGLRHLRTADVVVYNRVVHQRFLKSVRPDAEKIDVGPEAPQPIEQDAINFLLEGKAREGKTIACLKWGDSFFFESGGKEALFLHKQDIPFEVVPGVPLTIGGPCYAGVPLSYPKAGDALVFINGHDGETCTPPDVDWAKVAAVSSTVVSYARGLQLEVIMNELITHGRSLDEPAAVIFRGTLPTQQTIAGTLGEIQHVIKTDQRQESGVLIVGQVVGFRQHLRWFDSQPLFGKRILVTRPENQAGELVEHLWSLGADPIEAPTIRIEPPRDYGPLDEACDVVDRFDWIVFTSINGVDFFMQRLSRGSRDVRELKGVRLCAIGPSTAERLARYGLKVDLVPEEHRAEGIVETLRKQENLSTQRILLPRADLARDVLPTGLRQAGAAVVDVTAYRTVLTGAQKDTDVDIYKMLVKQEIDVVMFTSASAVRNLVKIIGAEPAADLLNSTAVATLGPVTAEAAFQLNIRTTIMPTTYTIPGLIDAIVSHFAETEQTIGR